MTAEESRKLKTGDHVDMVVTGGSGRVYKGEVIDANDDGNTIKWADGEVGTIEHVFADYLSTANE
jgi:hypothetical protein